MLRLDVFITLVWSVGSSARYHFKMRLLALLLLTVYYLSGLIAATTAPCDGCRSTAVLQGRAQQTNSTITTTTSSSSTTVPALRNSTATRTTAPASTTTVASLTEPNAFSRPFFSCRTQANSPDATTTPVPKGALPIKPQVTPALGVSGIILIGLGFVLAFIGIRNLWLSSSSYS